MEGKVFQSLLVLGMKEDLWERVRGLEIFLHKTSSLTLYFHKNIFIRTPASKLMEN